MPFQYLDLVTQDIVLVRNQPRIVEFQGRQQSGVDADFSDCLAARIRISTAFTVDVGSQIDTFTDFTPQAARQRKIFSAAEIDAMPIGTFLYEFQVSWVADEWETSHQGSIQIAPSIFTLNEV